MRNIRSPLSGFLSPLFASTALSSGGGGTAPIPEGRVAEISRMSGDRDPVVPQAYFDRVAREAFSTSLHPIGDPLVPSCVIYTHKAVKDGRWSDPTVWDTGTVPNANAVVCSGPYNLIYDVLSDVLIKDIHINGQGSLTFDPTVQTRLWVDTLSVDGRLVIGEFNAPIPDSSIVTGGKRVPQCEIVFWQSEAPLATGRLGLLTMGPVRIHGAVKESHLEALTSTPSNGSVFAGATSVVLSQDAASAGWKIGDEILVVGTEWAGTTPTDAQYEGPTQFYGLNQGNQGTMATFTQTAGFMQSQSEVRTITGISGNTVSFASPLAFNHLTVVDTLPRGDTVTLPPVVANLTRSIRFRTADASDTVWTGDLTDLQKRAHSMFMFDDDIQIRNAEFKNMGRTASDPSLNGPDGVTRYATSNTSQPITNVNNIFGRYAIHIHRTGAFFGRKQVAVEGCSAWAPTAEYPIPGWAMVHHDSRAAMDHNVIYNVRGAGMVSENGNEIGQWIGNVVAWCRGDGFPTEWGQRSEFWRNHNGHTGVAYETQARQILQQDNYAEGCRMGWMLLLQMNAVLDRIPDGDSLRYRDPITFGGDDFFAGVGDKTIDDNTYGFDQHQVPDFYRNHTWNCANAFWKAHQQSIDRADSMPMVFRECHWINSNVAYNIRNYTVLYYVYDSLWTGRGLNGTIGAHLGDVMWAMSFFNVKMKNFGVGFNDNGYSIAYNGFWGDIGFENVTTPFNGAASMTFPGAPTARAAWNAMGDAQVTGANTGIPRVWQAIDDADLPSPYPLAPFGPNSTERTDNPVPAVGDDPYVVIYPSTTTTLTPTGKNQSIKALIVDSLGYRWHGDHQNPESTLSMMTPKQTRSQIVATGLGIAARNGVFNDGGVWKTRCWFIDAGRWTGQKFTWHHDFILSGFDAGFLAANTVDPVATRPAVDILPEITRTGPVTTPAVHTITSAATVSVGENAPLAHVLKASTGKVRWAITGGVDAADFEVAYTGGQWLLRWVANSTKDFEAPDDTGANNVYDVQVTATDLLGRAVVQNVSATVIDVVESVTEFFDNFASPVGQFLDVRPGYERISGPANRLLIASDGTVGATGSATPTLYRLPDIGRTTDFVIRANFFQAGGAGPRIAPVDPISGVRLGVDRNVLDSQIRVFYNNGSTTTVWTYGNPINPLVEFRLVGTSFEVRFDGVLITPTSGPAQTISPLGAGSRFYLASFSQGTIANGAIDNLYIGPA